MRTGDQSSFDFFNPTVSPRIISKDGQKYREYKYRIDPPIEIEKNINVDELKKSIEGLMRKMGKRDYELDNQSSKNIYRYLQVLSSLAKIEKEIKKILKIYHQLIQDGNSQFPEMVNKKMNLLGKLRRQLLLINVDAQNQKNNRNRGSMI